MKRRRWRIRKKIVGTVERPRMSVRFTNKNIYVQFIDDDAGNTIASVSTRAKSANGLAANAAGAVEIGKLAGEAAKSAGIETVVFDLAETAWRRFDVPAHAVVSSLAVHHLDGPGKQALFRDMGRAIAPCGRLILAHPPAPAPAVRTASLKEREYIPVLVAELRQKRTPAL